MKDLRAPQFDPNFGTTYTGTTTPTLDSILAQLKPNEYIFELDEAKQAIKDWVDKEIIGDDEVVYSGGPEQPIANATALYENNLREQQRKKLKEL